MEDTAFDGAWWRFSAYEIRRGYIRPAANARLERFEPFPDFQAARNQRRRTELPHATLCNLVYRLEHGSNSLENAKSLVLDWCRRFGLLGLLLHQVHLVRFPPRWERLRPSSNPVMDDAKRRLKGLRQQPGSWSYWSQESAAPDDELYIAQRFYSRSAAGTFASGEQQFAPPLKRTGKRAPGAPVRGNLIAPAQPLIVLQDLQTAEWRIDSVAQSWGHFFPSIQKAQRDRYSYPELYSDEFWRLYGEPLNAFLSAAILLREGVMDAERGSSPIRLNRLAAPAGPALVPIGGHWKQRLVSASLLGSLAVMAQIELASERLVNCRNDRCGMLVSTPARQTAYCSPLCKDAARERRRYRPKGS